jgi:hypothetical protein
MGRSVGRMVADWCRTVLYLFRRKESSEGKVAPKVISRRRQHLDYSGQANLFWNQK